MQKVLVYTAPGWSGKKRGDMEERENGTTWERASGLSGGMEGVDERGRIATSNQRGERAPGESGEIGEVEERESGMRTSSQSGIGGIEERERCRRRTSRQRGALIDAIVSLVNATVRGGGWVQNNFAKTSQNLIFWNVNFFLQKKRASSPQNQVTNNLLRRDLLKTNLLQFCRNPF